MKCKKVKRFRKAVVKPFKHTSEMTADKCHHLINAEVIIVDLCTDKDIVYVKEDLNDLAFYQIHRKDLKAVK
jgi:hypothetical protein